MTNIIEVYQPKRKNRDRRLETWPIKNNVLRWYCMNPDECNHKQTYTAKDTSNQEDRQVQECTKKGFCLLAIPIRF